MTLPEAIVLFGRRGIDVRALERHEFDAAHDPPRTALSPGHEPEHAVTDGQYQRSEPCDPQIVPIGLNEGVLGRAMPPFNGHIHRPIGGD
jgi:hypothetical protein